MASCSSGQKGSGTGEDRKGTVPEVGSWAVLAKARLPYQSSVTQTWKATEKGVAKPSYPSTPKNLTEGKLGKFISRAVCLVKSDTVAVLSTIWYLHQSSGPLSGLAVFCEGGGLLSLDKGHKVPVPVIGIVPRPQGCLAVAPQVGSLEPAPGSQGRA